MNPQWDDGRRRQEPQHLRSILKKVPKPDEDWRRYSQSPGPAVDEPSTVQQGLDPVTDGAFLEVERVDVELARKRKELEDIEERIMHKKVAIALKHAKPLVESLSSGFRPGYDQTNSSSLRDKVHRIMQQRHPAGFLSQARSPKDRRNCAGSSINGLPQEQHPLKIRVKELMRRRSCLPCAPERMVTDVSPSPVAQPPADESCVNMGFQRFLTVLNKGVDMDLLTKIVNDGCDVFEPVETVLNHTPPAAVAEPCVPPNSESKQSSSRDESRTGSGSHSLGSSSRSRSPPGTRKMQEEEEKAKSTEQQEQLQNILKTLGLNLEVGEMSRLANRTQERLYGTKLKSANFDRHEKRPKQPRKHRNSSSRSSSSSSYSGSGSSRSSSRSVSPPSNRLTRSKDSLVRTTSEHSGGTKELLKTGAQPAHTVETSKQTHQENPHLGPSSAYHNARFPQHGPYDIRPSGFCDQPMGPRWPPRGGPYQPPYYPNAQPCQQNPFAPFHLPGAQPGSYYSGEGAMMETIDMQVAASDWQSDWASRPQYLREISTQSQLVVPPQCLQKLSIQQSIHLQQINICSQSKEGNKGNQISQDVTGRRRRRKRWKMKIKQRKLLEKIAEANKLKVSTVQKVSVCVPVTPVELAEDELKEEDEEEKPPPREAKIKAKLRIKLKAFNEEVKGKLPLPATSDTCESHLELTD